jgi:2-aminoadipate transaminase
MADDCKPFGFSARAGRASMQPISFLMAQAVTNPDLISLAAGLVDYQTLPAAQTRRLADELLRDEAAARIALQYGTTEGLAELREALLEHMAGLDGLTPADLGATPDDVVVSTGSQQLLQILTDILVDPGDIVITAWPSYFVFTGTLEAAGALVRCVDMDDGGVIPEALEALLQELADHGELYRVKMIYLVPYHQNPTGITLARERREPILNLVREFSREHRILLLEDAAYRELTFRGSPPRSIKSYDTGNEYVALLQTFSKSFSPGMKTGYGLLPRDLVEPVILQKGNHDFGSVNLCQHLLLSALRTGVYQEHVRALCDAYALKCAATLEALQEHLGDSAPGRTHWTRPNGGLYVYLTLPEEIDTGRDGALFAKAIAEGVLYVPGEYCYGPDPSRTIPRNTMRLSYGVADVADIHRGVQRLARAVKSVAAALTG